MTNHHHIEKQYNLFYLRVVIDRIVYYIILYLFWTVVRWADSNIKSAFAQFN